MFYVYSTHFFSLIYWPQARSFPAVKCEKKKCHNIQTGVGMTYTCWLVLSKTYLVPYIIYSEVILPFSIVIDCCYGTGSCNYAKTHFVLKSNMKFHHLITRHSPHFWQRWRFQWWDRVQQEGVLRSCWRCPRLHAPWLTMENVLLITRSPFMK